MSSRKMKCFAIFPTPHLLCVVRFALPGGLYLVAKQSPQEVQNLGGGTFWWRGNF